MEENRSERGCEIEWRAGEGGKVTWLERCVVSCTSLGTAKAEDKREAGAAMKRGKERRGGGRAIKKASHSTNKHAMWSALACMRNMLRRASASAHARKRHAHEKIVYRRSGSRRRGRRRRRWRAVVVDDSEL